MHRTSARPRRFLLAAWLPLAALVLLLFTLPELEGTDRDHPTSVVANPTGASALRVRLAPEEGTFLADPTPIQVSKYPELAEMLSRSDEGLVVERLPNGTLRVNLQGRFQNASVARIDEDGVLHTRCSDQLQELERHLAGAAAAASQPKLEVK